MAKATIAGTDTVQAALETKCNANFTELYNYLTGVAAPTLLTPTIASFANAGHTHANAAGGGTLTAAVLGGTITGTYTLGGTPTITAPTITGTSTIAIGSWTAITPGTGWSALGSVTIACIKDPFGIVHLQGTLSGSNGNATVLTLASGFRPAESTAFLVGQTDTDPNNYGSAFRVTIGTNGVMSAGYTTAGTSFIHLNGISFPSA